MILHYYYKKGNFVKKTFDIKKDCDLEDIKMLNPNVLVIFTTVLQFAKSRNLPVKITSLISDRGNIKTVSTTHEDGRAIDLSVKGWREKDIEDLIKIVNAEHDHIGAISKKTLRPAPIVYHNSGYGDHIHLQCKR